MKNALHFVAAIAFTLPVAHAQFSFTDLGSLPGGGPTPFVTASAMNSAGDVCGSSSFFDNTHAYLWKPTMPNGTMGGMMDLGAVPHPTGSNWSVCTAVSTYAPVGYGYNKDMSYRALVFTGGTFTGASVFAPFVLPIPETPSTFTPNSYAYAINDSGVIAGSWTASAGVYHALVWHPDGTSYSVSDLNAPGFPGWILNVATGVNKKGQVVGFGSFKGSTHAFLYTPGAGVTDLGSLTPAPYDYSVATGLNDMGQVVGYGTVLTPLGFRHHAWLWSKGTMTDLGVPPAPGTTPGSAISLLPPGAPKPPALPSPFQNSVAAAINNNGKIVGWANMAPVPSTLFMKSPYGWGTAVAYDTNKSAKAPGLVFGWNILSMPWVTVGAPLAPLGLVGPPPTSSMLAAFAINDSDQIAGWFIKPGPLTAGFLLTAPLPLKP